MTYLFLFSTLLLLIFILKNFYVKSENASLSRENKKLKDQMGVELLQRKELLLQNSELNTNLYNLGSKIDHLQGYVGEWKDKYNDLKLEIPILIKNERQNAVDVSRSVIKGKISEEIVPLIPGFPYQISDMKFFGAPIDFIIFEGMSDGNISNIILLDIKTGAAKLSSIQRKIKRAVEEGHVSWVTWNKE